MQVLFLLWKSKCLLFPMVRFLKGLEHAENIPVFTGKALMHTFITHPFGMTFAFFGFGKLNWPIPKA